MPLAKIYCIHNTNLALFHMLCKIVPNGGMNRCCRSEFLAPTSKVAAQTES